MTHRPTDERRAMVEQMSAAGITQEDIANVLGICINTLTEHYREELDNAATRANAQISGRLFERAMEGSDTALIWWTKARMKWKETKVEENRYVDKDNNDILLKDTELLKKIGITIDE